MNTHSVPQFPKLFMEQKRVGARMDTNGTSSFTWIEEAPACWGSFKLRVFSLLIFALISTGCFGNHVKPVVPSPIIKNWTSDEILDLVGQRAQAIRQVKALITVKIDGKQPIGFSLPVHTLQAALWAERPHQIKLQGFSPLGGTLFDLVSKDGRLQLSVPGRSKEVQSTLEEMLIQNAERSSFSLELLDALAGGGQPLLRPSEFSAIEQNKSEIILYQFLFNNGKTRLIRKYWLDGNRLLTKQAVYFDLSGRPSVTLLYHDYQTVPSSVGNIASPGGAPDPESFWPQAVTAIVNEQGQLAITFREVKLNQPFQAGTFSFGAVPR